MDPGLQERPARRHRLLAALAAGAASLSGCRAPEVVPPSSPGSPDAALDARVAEQVEARLRALFPDVQGPLTRESIAATVHPPATDASPIAEGDARAQAAEALRRGDDEAARRLLSELAASREAQAAAALLAAGDVEGALRAFDAALDVAPHSAALHRARGEVALDDGLARADAARIRSALDDFQEATRRAGADDPEAVRAALGTSRAARALGDAPGALDAARRAFAVARDARELEGGAEVAERTRAEALLAALPETTGANERAALVRETRAALEALVARTPDDPWAWSQLCAIQVADGAPLRASVAADTGLRVFPRDATLSDALASSTRAFGGRESVIATFEAIERRDRTDAGAVWRPAEERFARGVEALRTGAEGAEDELREAGRGFLRAGVMAPDRRAEANAAVARALTGVGLALHARGALSAARAAFLEAETRDPEALSEPLAPGLITAVEALRAIAATLEERGADPSRTDATECLAEAAATWVDLRRIAPRTSDAARVAHVAKEAALAVEARARVAAERGRVDEAQSGMTRARGLMEAAFDASVDAARAAPDDAAAVRWPGRLLVHFLQSDKLVTQAETWLRSAVHLSEQDVQRARAAADEPGLDAEQREERARRLEEAESRLGDAYQDLGVLHLDLKGDPHGARVWFEKALGTGPDPREDLRAPDGWIARCDAAIAAGTDSRLPPAKRWGVLR